MVRGVHGPLRVCVNGPGVYVCVCVCVCTWSGGCVCMVPRGGGVPGPGGVHGPWWGGGGIPACTEADPPCEQNHTRE